MNSTIYGGAGTDSIYNSGGDVTISGGVGNDLISLQSDSGNSELLYNNGDANDTILGFNDRSVLKISGNYSTAQSGDDIIATVGKGKITLKGAASLESVNIFKANGRLRTLTQDADTYTNTIAAATIAAFGGDDNIANNFASVSVNAGAGDDTITNSGKVVTINAGTGDDQISVSGSGLIQYAAGDGNDTLNYSSSYRIKLTSGKIDRAVLSDNNVVLRVGEGSITVTDAKSKPIYITNADGTSTVLTLNNKDEESFAYNAKKNAFTVDSDFTGTISASEYVSGVVSIIASDVEEPIEINGNANSNVIVGSREENTINGGAGNDTLIGNGILTGGDGSDFFVYGGGLATITDYTAGVDRISLNTAQIAEVALSGNDVILSTGDEDSLTIVNGKDKKITFGAGKSALQYIFEDKTIFNSGKTAATLTASSTGFNANDSLVTIDATRTESASVTGNIKANRILAGTGGATLNGGLGNDTLVGGAGADVFVYENASGNEVIQNYVSGADKISLGADASISSFAVNTKTKDLILRVGSNALTLKKVNGDDISANGKAVTLIDADDNETTTTYFVNRATAGAGVSLNAAFTGKTFTASSDVVTVDALQVVKPFTLNGNDKDNVLTGGTSNDTVYGKAGDDNLSGSAGNDRIYGEAGNDYLSGDAGNDWLSGGLGKDTLSGGAGNDILYGNEDDDSLTGDAGNDRLYGDAGDDCLSGDAGNDTLYGGLGKDTLSGGDGADILYGNEDDDSLTGGTGNDRLYGDAGDDYLSGDLGNDLLYGGAGADSLYGGEGNDYLNGNEDNDYLNGDAGNDTLYGGAGADSIYGGDGVDLLYGEAGNDTLEGGADNDRLYGQDGNDYLRGDAGNDLLIGGNGADTLYGGSGNDTLTGNDGADIFVYESGNDVIADYASGDKISLGSAISKATVSGANVILTIDGGTLTLTNAMSKKLTFIDADGEEMSSVIGSVNYTNSHKAAVTLPAYAEFATAATRTKAIQIVGNKLDNTITGTAYNDKINGGDGDDSLIGGKGNDSLWGGNGADTFLYAEGDGRDIIFGFDNADLLEITGFSDSDSVTGATSGNDFIISVGSTEVAVLRSSTATTFNVKLNDAPYQLKK